MAIVDLVMPRMGESIVEATVIKWRKKQGDHVDADETLLDVATDKVDSEVPSTTTGIISELLYQENDVVPVGAVIARIDAANGKAMAQPAKTAKAQLQKPAAQAKPAVVQQKVEEVAPGGNNGNRFYSPLVLNIAGTEGIGMAELERIPGTGNGGRVSKKDILNYVANRSDYKAEETAAPRVQEVVADATTRRAVQEYVSSATAGSNNTEIIEMDRMRKLIAEHMVRSKATSAHVTSFMEADVTNIVKWRDKVKGQFESKYGDKITFTPIFIEAIVNCIRKYRLINSSVDGDKIILKRDINIGMATALPNGNLIVPVIKNADTKNLLGLTKDVNSLANAARNNKLKADDTQGGTFTVTNVGTFGSLMGTPIINQPQVAILAIGAIKKRPVVLETEDGDVIAIRHITYLSLTYDHRIIDGSLGATFLTAVANELEAFSVNREV